jgi:predicted PurR-regulated permease PerM
MDLFLVVIMGLCFGWTLIGQVRRLRKKGLAEGDLFPAAIASSASVFFAVICIVGGRQSFEPFGYPNVGIIIGALISLWLNPKVRDWVEKLLQPSAKVAK